MIRFPRRALFALFLAASTLPAVAQAMCKLPETGDAVVLTLDVVDASAPRNPPLIAVHADGRMAVREQAGSARLRLAQMPRADLVALIAFVTEKARFADMTTGAIRAALAEPASGTSGSLAVTRIADAPTSFLTLSLPGCTHSVAVEGSALRSQSRKDIDALQRFRQIESRLLELVAKVQLAQ